MKKRIFKRSFLDRIVHQVAVYMEKWSRKQRFRVELKQAQAEISIVNAWMLEILSDNEKEKFSVKICEVHEENPGYLVRLGIIASDDHIYDLNRQLITRTIENYPDMDIRYVSGCFENYEDENKDENDGLWLSIRGTKK